MLRKSSWKESPEDGGGGPRRRGLSAARCLNQCFWESCWVIPAGHLGQAHPGALSMDMLTVLEPPWLTGNPKAGAQNPRAVGLKFRAQQTSLSAACLSPFRSFHTHGKASIPRPPTPPILPLAAAPLSQGQPLPRKVPSGQSHLLAFL